MLSELIFYKDLEVYGYENPDIKVVNMDTLDCAIQLKNEGFNPVLLNMCNPNLRGGYLDRVGSQEEDLVRRGNYLTFLNSVKYPLPKYGLIYSPDVTFELNGLRQRYTKMSNPCTMSIIACSSINSPPMEGTYILPPYSNIIANKIDTIFQIAHKKGHDALVLSALGCGGFRNAPEHISQLFVKSIKTWGKCFKKIYFAIFDDNYPKSNYQIFKNEIEKYLHIDNGAP